MSERERVEALARVLDEHGYPTPLDRERAARIVTSDWLRDLMAEAKADAWDEGASASSENEARAFWMDGKPITNPYRETTTGADT